ncbi:MAG TPA: tetratricopeptide repeat protein [Burkholderiales bacterium]|nr:tetratricopeptide repeat protein [Burkholderiales bacterium]
MAVVRALLITDVVDSTRLSATLGDAATARLWAAHDRLARDLLRDTGGREIDKSDGMLLLFDTASAAVRYAFAYHGALRTLEVPIKARAALHVGPIVLRENSAADVALGAKPLEVDGIAKAVAARVMATAQGGQTLLTSEAGAALRDTPLKSHGYWRMKGIAEPLEVLEARPAAGEFVEPLEGASAYRVARSGEVWLPVREIKHRLPAERDAFVGRHDQLADLAARFAAGARLVSILGMGGSGKTRLATRFAWANLGEFPGGAWFCDLVAARSLDGIARAVADALDVPLGKDDPLAQLGAAIGARGACLVILDNFEQVARHSVETLGRWLDRAASARFLVTTREVLGLPGEQTIALPPLPPMDAATLFGTRAKSANQNFDPSAEDTAAIAELARLLDGLPLAIELAAARVRVMAPKSLLARVSERFKLLASSGSRRDRQATLRATFDWSWDLLSATDKAAFAQLSVFEGGFTLAAAEAVLDLDDGAWAGDAVNSLVDKSFVRSVGTERFDLLVSVQEYAAEHLRTEGRFPGSGPAAAAAAEERHWKYFAGLTEHQAIAQRCIETDNLVAACRRACARGATVDAAGALERAWAAIKLRGPYRVVAELAPTLLAQLQDRRVRARVELVSGDALAGCGNPREARAHLAAALALAREAGDDNCVAGGLTRLGYLDTNEGRMAEARGNFEAAVVVARAAADAVAEWEGCNGLGSILQAQGQIEQALVHFEAALEVSRRMGDRRREGRTLGNLGILHSEQGRLAEARAHFESALALAHEIGDRQWEGNTLCNLGLLYQVEGRSAAARQALEQGLAVARELGTPRLESLVLCNLGIVCDSLGQLDLARAHLESAIRIARELMDRRSEGQFLSYRALVDAHQGNYDAARSALDAGEQLLRAANDKFSLGILQCGRAETEHLAGAKQAAADFLAAAAALAAEVGAGPQSELGQAIARQRAAIR